MSRKGFMIVIIFVMLIITYSIGAAGAGYFVQKKITVSCGNIKLFFNGVQVSDNLPVMVTNQGVAMIPARSVLNLLGNTVYWDKKNHTIQIESTTQETGKAKEPWTGGKSSFETQYDYSWLENMTVIRNVGPFYRQSDQGLMVAAGAHSHGIAVKLKENAEAEVAVRTNGQYEGIEGWLGVEDESMNSSGNFILTIFADGQRIYESGNTSPGSYPRYIDPDQTAISGALTVKFHVKWVSGGTVGDYKELVVALADFKLIKK